MKKQNQKKKDKRKLPELDSSGKILGNQNKSIKIDTRNDKRIIPEKIC